jgi:hypothetical protein
VLDLPRPRIVRAYPAEGDAGFEQRTCEHFDFSTVDPGGTRNCEDGADLAPQADERVASEAFKRSSWGRWRDEFLLDERKNPTQLHDVTRYLVGGHIDPKCRALRARTARGWVTSGCDARWGTDRRSAYTRRMSRIVWVLGAGFSKPLGGPLLPDLFSSGSRDRLLAAYGDAGTYQHHLFSRMASEVRRLYAEHGRGGPPASRRWDDAEQFLEALDAAALHGAGSPSANLIRALCTVNEPDLGELAVAARGVVAAECSAFLGRADPTTERWGPYKRWLTSLREQDAIITFNYDTVIETIARAARFDRLVTAIPGKGLGTANFLKLHGSVNWQFDGSKFGVHEDDEFALTCPSDQMVIASPGPNKLAVATRLEELWATAETLLRSATAVVFIGYRFPSSDAASRRRLFMALAQNDQPYVALHTVLGPDKSDPATVRMRSLLLHAALQAGRKEAVTTSGTQYERSSNRTYTLDVHPLWGEDFMDLFVTGHVIQAYRFPRA